MRAPLSWLRDYAPFTAPVEQLATALSELGLVVDGVERVGESLEGVEVVRILDIRPHPDADRIRLVDVDRGDGEALQIACGAWNMSPGDLVPLATVGSVLPGGMEISRRKMRGQWSNGMLCAPGEIGLPDQGVDGLMILPPGLAEPGTPIAEALDLRPDVVFDLDITANRPDALCMAGVARDLAAALGLPFSFPDPEAPATDTSAPVPSLVVDDPDLCPRLTGTVFTGVEVRPSPAWLARRLTLAGMRPISNVVDVSNYVMLDLGQPTHPYDLARVPGGGLVVRRARPGEKVTTLDGEQRALAGDDCVICDVNSDPLGIGGIMGGASSEIGAGTTSVLLEAAWFSPMAIARTGTRLKLSSDARYRFERGVDPEMPRRAVDRFAGLLAASSEGLHRGPTAEVTSERDLPARPTVVLRTARVNRLLGTSLSDAEVAGLIEPIGFRSHSAGEGVQSVTIPSWRLDSEREVDVIEEVARLYGYRRIERTMPAGVRTGAGLSPYQRERRAVRSVLAGAGLSEAWTTTFLGPGDLERAGLAAAAVAVENPLDRSESILRTSLLPGLLKAARFNADRQEPEVRLFEIGRVFNPPTGDDVLPDEVEALAAVATGAGVDGRWAARLWAVLSEALRLVGVTLEAGVVPGLHPGRGARIVGPGDTRIGVLGEVDAEVSAAYGLAGRVGWLEVALPVLLDNPRRPRRAAALSRFPASDVDLAFVVADSEPAAAVAATLEKAGGSLLESVRLFDVYRGVGEGRRSLAFRLRFRSAERTLTDEEVAAARKTALEAVAAVHGGELRG